MYQCILIEVVMKLIQQLQCVLLVKTTVGGTGPKHACKATTVQSVIMSFLKPCLHPLPRTRWRLFTPKNIIQRLTHTGIFMSMSTVHLCLKNRIFPMTACNFSSLFKSPGIELGFWWVCCFFFFPLHLSLSEISFVSCATSVHQLTPSTSHLPFPHYSSSQKCNLQVTKNNSHLRKLPHSSGKNSYKRCDVY